MYLPAAAKAMRQFLDKCDMAVINDDDATSVKHVCEMLDAIENETVTGEKGHRWLGWAQAVICCRGGANLEQMKAVNLAA